MYERGEGVDKDLARAVHWYEKAAEQGQMRAQLNVARAFHTGKGVEQDFVRAMQWYTKAAEQGDACAQCNIGILYKYGCNGVEQDLARATQCFTQAAEGGNSSAQYFLGCAFEGRRGRREGPCAGGALVRQGGRAGPRRREAGARSRDAAAAGGVKNRGEQVIHVDGLH